jgi:dihydropyrimidine dehydrogenase (NAD+) subunit PreA
VIYAGDCAEGPTTVVEASASGKNAADKVEALWAKQTSPSFARNRSGHVKSHAVLPGYRSLPVSLETDFFGRSIRSPFLLSAAPPTDGIDQLRKAYEAGWAGGIMKTAFDGVPIHIPGEYMFAFAPETYANCDNVSGHPLERVCREVEQLRKEYPDRLTIASTGGPVTGKDEEDRTGWLSNTRKLEDAGVMAIEYSLSCPQGGDGTEGDIVSQNAALTAKIIGWLLEAGAADVPKLFKLTGAVTSMPVIALAVKEILGKHPTKKAGITLANSFPTLAFRPGQKKSWDEGIIVGASGAGILHISYLSLAKVAHLGLHVSGNGGPMDYKAAADFLALGARTVQFCTLAMKYGYGVVDDMHAGLSHLMAARGLRSVAELIGKALPDPWTDFMALSSKKKISSPNRELCLQCGNCTRCPYLAIRFDPEGYPATRADRCIGCSICARKCFSTAITMRDRTSEELAALSEI